MAEGKNGIKRRVWQVIIIITLLVLLFLFGDKIITTITGLGLLLWEKLKEHWDPVSSVEEHEKTIAALEERITALKTAGEEMLVNIEKTESSIRSHADDLSEADRQKLALLDSIAKKQAEIDSMTLEELVSYANTHH
jgi:hypothetical protein